MKDPIRLILVRHGNTFEAKQIPTQIGSRTDLSLTAQGRKQAELMADYLLHVATSPSGIYAGTLKRQIEFAEIIGSRLSMTKRLNLRESALTELDYGAWEGLTCEDIAHRFPKEYADWIKTGKWAEGIFGGHPQQHTALIEKWLTSLRKTYVSGETIVAVSSSGLLRLFLMENEKVQTGHFCELELYSNSLKVKRWNVKPTIQ